MKEVIYTVPRVDVILLPGGNRVVNPVGEVDYEIVRAAPNSDPSAVYLRRQHRDGRSYLWTGVVADWSAAVPETDERWERE